MNILSGIIGIITDPPSLFAFITLLVTAGITVHNPAAWPALAAFCGVVPPILGFCQHRITIAQLAQNVQANMPNKGQL